MDATRISRDCLIVIFGASGDLTKRKLVPSLFDLFQAGRLPERCAVAGVSRSAMSDDQFRETMKPWCAERASFTDEAWASFASRIHYQPCDATEAGDFNDRLLPRLRELAQEHGTGENLLLYLSIAPELYESVIANIDQAELVTEGKRWCSLNPETMPWQRVVVEKPFGYDLGSAERLNRALGRVFEEESIYRIDHYLGKETVQNLLVFRFANAIWEPIWNRNYVDHVQITGVETVGVEGRGRFYEKTGAMRDMIQSHLLQVMAMVAMEPPNSFAPEDLRGEQRKVLEAVRPIAASEATSVAVRGQYGAGRVDGRTVPAYRDEPDVGEDSSTETYAAMRLFVDNWRWRDVPFYVRTGKAMHRKLTQIVVTFKPTPHCLFADADAERCPRPNRLVVNVQPDEGISLRFEGKVPGEAMTIRSAIMDFDYGEQFEADPPEAYAHLLLDAIEGDRSLYKNRREIEAAWRIVEPVLEAWAAEGGGSIPTYEAGSWGPVEADRLIAADGQWRNPEGKVSRSKFIQKG